MRSGMTVKMKIPSDDRVFSETGVQPGIHLQRTGCYARALSRMKAEGMTGCKTVFDVAPAYLSR